MSISAIAHRHLIHTPLNLNHRLKEKFVINAIEKFSTTIVSMIMNLIFTEIKNHHQCGSQAVIQGLKVQCAFSSSKIVTIPKGLHYFDGNLDFSQSALSATFSICEKHELGLNEAFNQRLNKNPKAAIFQGSDLPIIIEVY